MSHRVKYISCILTKIMLPVYSFALIKSIGSLNNLNYTLNIRHQLLIHKLLYSYINSFVIYHAVLCILGPSITDFVSPSLLLKMSKIFKTCITLTEVKV